MAGDLSRRSDSAASVLGADLDPQSTSDRLQAILRAAPVGIGLVVDRVFQDVNDRLCEMVGYTREELIGQSARMLYPTQEEYESAGREKYAQIAAAGTGAVETRFRRSDGRILDVLLSSSPQNPSDLSKGVAFTVLDISQRKQDERHRQLLAESQIRLLQTRDLAEIYRMTAEGVRSLIGEGIVITVMRDEAAGSYVLAAIEGLGRPLETVIRAIGVNPLGKPYRVEDVAEEELGHYRNGRLEKREGGLRALSLGRIPAPLAAAAEKLLGITDIYTMGFVHNDAYYGGVTILARGALPIPSESIEALIKQAALAVERVLAEQALRESEDKFKYVFDYSNVGKSLTLPGGRVNANQTLSDMLGYTRDEMADKTWQSLTPLEDIPATQEILDPLLAGKKESARFRKRYLRKDGSILWADVSTSLRRDAAGRPLYFMTSLIDVSDLVQTEAKLREQIEELRRWHAITLDRESRILELKGEINGLCRQAGLPLRYPSAEGEGG